jgi:hypothetical protein
MSLTKATTPQLKHDNWNAWLTKFKNHVGKKLFTYLDKPKPELDNSLRSSLLAPDGEPTAETRAYDKLIRQRVKKWKNKKDKLHQYLMNACSDTPSAFPSHNSMKMTILQFSSMLLKLGFVINRTLPFCIMSLSSTNFLVDLQSLEQTSSSVSLTISSYSLNSDTVSLKKFVWKDF